MMHLHRVPRGEANVTVTLDSEGLVSSFERASGVIDGFQDVPTVASIEGYTPQNANGHVAMITGGAAANGRIFFVDQVPPPLPPALQVIVSQALVEKVAKQASPAGWFFGLVQGPQTELSFSSLMSTLCSMLAAGLNAPSRILLFPVKLIIYDDAVWLRSVLLCDSRMTWHDLALVMFSLVHTYPGIRVYGLTFKPARLLPIPRMTYPCKYPNTPGGKWQKELESLAGNPTFNEAVELINLEGLESIKSLIDGKEDFTMFMPNDKALAGLAEQYGLTTEDFKSKIRRDPSLARNVSGTAFPIDSRRPHGLPGVIRAVLTGICKTCVCAGNPVENNLICI
eukprot:105613-Pelagomonas_calceolata.AAC.5